MMSSAAESMAYAYYMPASAIGKALAAAKRRLEVDDALGVAV